MTTNILNNSTIRKGVTLAFALFLVGTVPVQAQSHGNHLMLDVGASYPKGLEASVAYEHETNYHNAWEYFATAYLKYETDPTVGHITNDSFWHNYNTWNVGIAYKPCVTRSRNQHGSFRIGASVGSDLDKVLGIGHIGYEHTFNLYYGWSMFFQVKEDIVIRGKDTFRTGATIGIKIPL